MDSEFVDILFVLKDGEDVTPFTKQRLEEKIVPGNIKEKACYRQRLFEYQ